MGKATFTGRINLAKLTDELGVGVTASGARTDDGGTTDYTADVPDNVLQSALAAHVYDPDYGVPDEDREMRPAIRQKAQAVLAGQDTFTNAQIQRAVAALILRETRRG